VVLKSSWQQVVVGGGSKRKVCAVGGGLPLVGLNVLRAVGCAMFFDLGSKMKCFMRKNLLIVVE